MSVVGSDGLCGRMDPIQRSSLERWNVRFSTTMSRRDAPIKMVEFLSPAETIQTGNTNH